MKKAALILSLITSLSHAGPVHHTQQTHRVTGATLNIEHITVDNPRRACEQKSRELGNSGFAYTVDACAFWWEGSSPRKCIIITGKITNLETLGHEYLHCLKGDWHDQNIKKP